MTAFGGIYGAVMLFVMTLIGVSLIFEKKSRISPTPVLRHVRTKALSMIPLSFDGAHKYLIADLGCGWGGCLFALLGKFPQSTITGYEISPFPFALSKIRTFFQKDISVLRENFFEKDLSGLDIVMCYLSPYHMEKLVPQFLTMKSGSAIVSCSFPIKDWIPVKTEYVRGLFVTIPVFLYVIK
ncbi:MAG: class I SAM-dependent methyltransferase [Alphaproteobacteria bacterium]|nr:class I SAM-dependent methyltransferase [Alphaproteobacteria bacterium]MCB1550572.1 class I SAM-dependent methyltransferase [Alphaproteobacteria bacterium]MCB9984220.1 class I SAM-dependent methyltransferase [Micavibrio sp.]HPQ51331.1 class I SAM-dependent methyltransferase [Alphaproteobacteria bacterium]HRK97064.1 class I SAM-dependent methyltransferase [Alphaproteobacteria bacterium]